MLKLFKLFNLSFLKFSYNFINSSPVFNFANKFSLIFPSLEVSDFITTLRGYLNFFLPMDIIIKLSLMTLGMYAASAVVAVIRFIMFK